MRYILDTGQGFANVARRHYVRGMEGYGRTGLDFASPALFNGFSQLSATPFFVFQKMESCETERHLLCRVVTSAYNTKITLGVFKLLHNERKGDFMANKTNSIVHTKWMCKYHIVLLTIRDIIKQLCAYKRVQVIEGHLMPDHIYMAAIPVLV